MKYNTIKYQESLIDSFKLKLKVFHDLFQKYESLLSSSIDDAISTGIGLMIGIIQSDMHSTELTKNRNYKFYSDPNISEIKPTILLLNTLKERVQTELQQWPDHPVLHDVFKFSNYYKVCELIVFNFSDSKNFGTYIFNPMQLADRSLQCGLSNIKTEG